MHGEGLTNAGKKEQRQINQVLNKELISQDNRGLGKEPEARTVPKQSSLKPNKTPK